MKRYSIALVALAAILIGLLPTASTTLDAQEDKVNQQDRRLANSQWGNNYFPNVELTSSKGEKFKAVQRTTF